MTPCRDRRLPKWITDNRMPNTPADITANSTTDTDVYCTCRRPWDGRFMIQCDYCDEWYHGSCVDITQTDALDIDKYR
ncbi:hypothetical protein DPMN_192424 [Dreissena polymorpha]|uniref:PHD-type domain-containing protein n=1 Tax=Dreissena polymorpha TaxID=45954 RepID=A0A9D3Y1G2_DREPO|nr:hypothetical protein DPMN_192424 [Dreissena polymorpha]